MKQSRLEAFFQSTSSSLKRLSSVNNEENRSPTEKIKRLKSDEHHFSLNQFYLNKFLTILSSAMTHHQTLFEPNEFDLFEKYQQLPSSISMFLYFLLCCNCFLFSFIANCFNSFADATM